MFLPFLPVSLVPLTTTGPSKSNATSEHWLKSKRSLLCTLPEHTLFSRSKSCQAQFAFYFESMQCEVVTAYCRSTCHAVYVALYQPIKAVDLIAAAAGNPAQRRTAEGYGWKRKGFLKWKGSAQAPGYSRGLLTKVVRHQSRCDAPRYCRCAMVDYEQKRGLGSQILSKKSLNKPASSPSAAKSRINSVRVNVWAENPYRSQSGLTQSFPNLEGGCWPQSPPESGPLSRAQI